MPHYPKPYVHISNITTIVKIKKLTLYITIIFFVCVMAQQGKYFYFFNFLLIFIGVSLFYNVVLVSNVQQSESAIRIHIFPLFWVPFPFRSPQNTE